MIKGFGANIVVTYKNESSMNGLKGQDFDLVFDMMSGHRHWEVA